MEVSASILIQYHQAAWKPQKPPNAISIQRKKPPSTGTALDSSVATRACDRPQNRRPTRSISAAAPGPASRTIGSSPKGPEETKMKIVPARVRTPSPRCSSRFGVSDTLAPSLQKKEGPAGLLDGARTGPVSLRTGDRSDLDAVAGAAAQHGSRP